MHWLNITAATFLLLANYPPVIHRDFYCKMVTGPERPYAMDRLNEVVNRDKHGRIINPPFDTAMLAAGLGDSSRLIAISEDTRDPDTAHVALQILATLHDCDAL